jgi:CRISPR/Cas system CSM-associated protein Csm4 (group 5 of RAMP superfamily)
MDATQTHDTSPSEKAKKNDDIPKKTMKRIHPEKIAEVGEWKAEKKGEEADVEDNVEMSTEDPQST